MADCRQPSYSANPWDWDLEHIVQGAKGDPGPKGDPGATGRDGRGITSITKTGTTGLVDTYTITYSDGTTSTYTVTNGRDGSGGGGGGSDGFSPIVTVTEITGGHRISIQDKTHTATFDVMDGTDGTNGTNGTNGTDGTDGVSPTVTVTSITGGHRVTITDAEHPSGMYFDVMDGTNGRDGTNGTNGSDGVSPVVSISTITGGNAVTITDATHPSGQTFNVMNGVNGSDYVLTAQDKSDIAALVNVSTPRIAKTSSDTVAELEPNKLYVFPEMSALTITLATPSDANIVNEYHFMFTSGATATTLTIPSTVSEPSGFSVEANMTYEVSIMENCMLANSWAVSS